MRCDFFDFDPNFKVLIAGNNKPSLRSVDEAIRRRLLLLPFTVTIPKDKRDREFADKLRPEWPAILRWMLDGCLEWRKSGLFIPKIVHEASDKYFADQDVLQQWLTDYTKDDPLAFTTSTALFKSWQAWCTANDHEAGSRKALVMALDKKGYQHKDTKSGRGFKGIALITGGQTQMETDLGEGWGDTW
jgi:putative DNA primase/helicase